MSPTCSSCPRPSTSALRCTNLRTLDGKRPVFIDDIKAVFFFPYLHIRFVEIPAASLIGTELEVQVEAPVAVAAPVAADGMPTTTTSRSTRTSSGASARSDDPPPFGRDQPNLPRRPAEVRVREGPGATLPAVSKNLVIVESPAKARTIERYLGRDYRVLASYGHVRDLPENPGKGKFGVDVDHDFEPEYVISDDRRKQVNDIEKAARKSSDLVYLATDLDREGEAIAWHVAEAANVPAEKTRRVTFSEITEPAIREAFANPRDIDQNLVDAQQTRRIVDRLVGYTLSPLLSRKVRGGLSAGRVQSVAVRLVVEREREIEAFTAREYWTIEAHPRDGRRRDVRGGARAHRRRGARRRRTRRRPTATSRRFARRKPIVRKIGVRTQKRSPAPPFTTSTLQQEASRKLLVQPQADDVDRPAAVRGRRHGRTASSPTCEPTRPPSPGVAMGEAREVIAERYGEPFTMPKGRVYKTKSKGAQEAHESIRPTSFRRDPDSLAGMLKPEELRLYRLIWQRALASQMAPKELETTTVELDDGPYELRASSTKTLFEGFARVYTEGRDDGAERGRGGERSAARPWPRATRPRSATSRRPSTSPSRRRASPRRR